MFTDVAVLLLVIAMMSYTCHGSCQFPVYVQSSAAEPARRRDWRARSRSPRVAATPMRVVVDDGTLSWNTLEQEGDATPMWVDRCLEEIKLASGLYVLVSGQHSEWKFPIPILVGIPWECKGNSRFPSSIGNPTRMGMDIA